MPKLTSHALRAVTMAVATSPVAAIASQGPGGGPGTASHVTQLTMTALIYGGCALIIAAGLIGGLRRPSR